MWGWLKLLPAHTSEKPAEFIDRLYAMRLNEKLGIEIKGEGKPEIGYPGDKLLVGNFTGHDFPWI